MKPTIAISISFLFGLLMLSGCNVTIGISGSDLRATQAAVTEPTAACVAKQTAQVNMETAVAETLTAQPTPNIQPAVETACEATQIAMATLTGKPMTPLTETVAFESFHGRYVTAMGEEDNWALKQEVELGDCGWFTQYYINGCKVALKTCHDRYVTAPMTDIAGVGWVLRQESELGECGQFTLYDLGHDRVAFGTCIRRFVVAADDSWEPEWHWIVAGQADNLSAWETFTVIHPWGK